MKNQVLTACYYSYFYAWTGTSSQKPLNQGVGFAPRYAEHFLYLPRYAFYTKISEPVKFRSSRAGMACSIVWPSSQRLHPNSISNVSRIFKSGAMAVRSHPQKKPPLPSRRGLRWGVKTLSQRSISGLHKENFSVILPRAFPSGAFVFTNAPLKTHKQKIVFGENNLNRSYVF